MNLKEFFETKEKIAIHCDTKEKAIKLCKAFHDMGKTWSDGESYVDLTRWGLLKESNCYSNTGALASRYFCEKSGVEIIPFDEIEDFQEPKEVK